MHDTFRLFLGAAYIVWALIAVREFIDPSNPRALWVKACLIVSAVTAALAAVAMALIVNGRANMYISPPALREVRTLFAGVTIGLILALLLSGQLSKKKPPGE